MSSIHDTINDELDLDLLDSELKVKWVIRTAAGFQLYKIVGQFLSEKLVVTQEVKKSNLSNYLSLLIVTSESKFTEFAPVRIYWLTIQTKTLECCSVLTILRLGSDQ